MLLFTAAIASQLLPASAVVVMPFVVGQDYLVLVLLKVIAVVFQRLLLFALLLLLNLLVVLVVVQAHFKCLEVLYQHFSVLNDLVAAVVVVTATY